LTIKKGKFMVFGFFKEMLASMKEGIDEAKAEATAEAEVKKGQEQVAFLSNQQNLLDKFKNVSNQEKFYTALGAPYRETFIGDLSNAKTEQRQAFYLYAMDVPQASKEEIAQLIDRDFGVVDKDSLQAMAALMELSVYILGHPDMPGFLMQKLNISLEKQLSATDDARLQAAFENVYSALDHDYPALMSLLADFRLESRSLGVDFPDEKLGLLALWMSRLSYMASCSVALGYITKSDALAMLTNLVDVGLVKIHSWKQFGELFVIGDKQDGSNNVLGRKFLASRIEKLMTESHSPWVEFTWPVNQLALSKSP
jgi:Protein of unknown function (DUF1266)